MLVQLIGPFTQDRGGFGSVLLKDANQEPLRDSAVKDFVVKAGSVPRVLADVVAHFCCVR